MKSFSNTVYSKLSLNEVFDKLKSNKSGLTNKQALKRITKYGENKINTNSSGSLRNLFKNNNELYLLLGYLVLLVVYFAISADYVYLFLGFLLVIISIKKSSKGINRNIFNPVKSVVIRDNIQIETSSNNLTIGDIIIIKEGMTVPADARLISDQLIITNNSLYTGIDNFVYKTNLDVNNNIFLHGEKVVYGQGLAIVIETGINTTLGKIISLDRITSEDKKFYTKSADRLIKTYLYSIILITFISLFIRLTTKTNLISNNVNNDIADFILIISPLSFMLFFQIINWFSVLDRTFFSNYEMLKTDVVMTDIENIFSDNRLNINNLFIGKNSYKAVTKPLWKIVSDHNQDIAEVDFKKLSIIAEAAYFSSLPFDLIKKNQPTLKKYLINNSKNQQELIKFANHFELDINEHNYKMLAYFSLDKETFVSVVLHNKQTIAYIQSTNSKILDNCESLWDHDHIRPFHKSDGTYFKNILDHNINTTAVTYIAYKNLNNSDFKLKDIKNNYTFLSAITTSHNDKKIIKSLQKFKNNNIKLILTSNNFHLSQYLTEVIKSLNKNNVVKMIDQNEITSSIDEDLKKAFDSDFLILNNSTWDSKLRIIELLKLINHNVLFASKGLYDAVSLKRATYGLDTTMSNLSVGVNNFSIFRIERQIERSKKNIAWLVISVNLLLTNIVTIILILLSDLITLTYWHTPIDLTQTELILLIILGQIVPILVLSKRKIEYKKILLMSQLIDKNIILNGLIISLLGLLNFAFFYFQQQISPRFIATTNPIYLQSISILVISLIIMNFINILLNNHYLNHKHKMVLNHKYNIWFYVFIIILISIIVNVILSAKLTAINWFSIIIISFAYYCFKRIKVYSAKHTKKALVKLHQEIFNERS